jgi:TctA family transporter
LPFAKATGIATFQQHRQFDVWEVRFSHAIAVNVALQAINNGFQMTFVVIGGRVNQLDTDFSIFKLIVVGRHVIV